MPWYVYQTAWDISTIISLYIWNNLVAFLYLYRKSRFAHSLEKISDTVPFLVVKLQFIEIFQIYCWLMIYDVAHLLVVNQNRCCMSSCTFVLTVLCCIYLSASHMPHLSLHCHSRHYRKDCNYSELSYFSCIFFSFCCIWYLAVYFYNPLLKLKQK